MKTMSGIGLALALLLVMGACGDDDATSTTTTSTTSTTAATTTTSADTTTSLDTTTTEASTTTTEAATTTVATSGRFLTTGDDAGLGDILVDQDGFTLYLFLPDDQGASTCTGACAVQWPPLENGDVGAGAGVDPDLLGTVERSDGTLQVTYNDWPLYYYSLDVAPGSANGQGIGGNWWVVSPEGDPVME